jgi:hypothetical protein
MSRRARHTCHGGGRRRASARRGSGEGRADAPAPPNGFCGPALRETVDGRLTVPCSPGWPSPPPKLGSVEWLNRAAVSRHHVKIWTPPSRCCPYLAHPHAPPGVASNCLALCWAWIAAPEEAAIPFHQPSAVAVCNGGGGGGGMGVGGGGGTSGVGCGGARAAAAPAASQPPHGA